MEQQCGRKIELRLNEEQKKICFRSCAAARRAYNWKLAELHVNPEIDWNDLAGVHDFERLFQPRLDNASRLGSEWERHLLNECIRLGIWRLWFVQWCEYTETAAFINTRVFPPWEIKKAQAFAKGLGEHLTCLNLKRWLLMGNDEFVRESGASPNKDVMMEMRRVMGARCRRKCK